MKRRDVGFVNILPLFDICHCLGRENSSYKYYSYAWCSRRMGRNNQTASFSCMRMCLHFYIKCIAINDERNTFALHMMRKYVILIIKVCVFNLYNGKISKSGGFAADCRGIQMEQKKVWAEEENLKNLVYTSLDRQIKDAAQAMHEAKEVFEAEKYEEQDKFIVAGNYYSAQKEAISIKKRLGSLMAKPYYAHICIQWKEENETQHFLISDDEQLDHSIDIKDDKSVSIVPFKDDADRPLLKDLRILYSMPQKRDVTTGRDGAQSTFTPQTVRDVNIRDQKLLSVHTLLDVTASGAEPAVLQTDQAGMAVDELLAQRLEENRTDARLRNIISTLQKQQYEIIQSDIEMSFVVQGCAGSGKTQCMIHRLFYLRESLSEDGWNRVMLITPTQLFRNYSSELMRRYRLTDIANQSLAQFYCRLLDAYDPRFRNRQYIFELSEEYLPDAYLQQAYSAGMIATINNEINHAIQNHVETGLYLLGEKADRNTVITIELVNDIVRRLADRIVKFDETEKALSMLPEYAEHRAQMDALEKENRTLLRRQTELLERKEMLAASDKQFNAIQAEIKAAEQELLAWKQEGKSNIEALADALRQCERDLDESAGTQAVPLQASRYVQALYRLCDATEPWGEQRRYDLEYRTLLEGIVDECRQKLQDFTKKMSHAAWMRDHEKRILANRESLEKVAEALEQNQRNQEEQNAWLTSYNVADAERQRSSQRATLERARYYLSRIESSVFEQEVWNALKPFKEKHGIQTMQIEQLPDGYQKQTRILYKSDLLFYLKIYAALHTSKNLPKYRMICIDEGQDLHRADYTFLKSIYPNARFNIFGDTTQSLHDACGVRDWRMDTGIETVFEMNSNYRNTPAIVEFCNRMFGENMEYCGKVLKAKMPVAVHRNIELTQIIRGTTPTVIVKDRQAFDDLLVQTGIGDDEVVYLDTKADAIPENKIVCFTIYAAKGMEFTSALVYAKDMSRNQKNVACTRAMEKLYYYE